MAQPPFPYISPPALPRAASACWLSPAALELGVGYSGPTWAPPPQCLKTTCCILSSPVGREKISSPPGNSLRPVPATNERPPPPLPVANERPPPPHLWPMRDHLQLIFPPLNIRSKELLPTPPFLWKRVLSPLCAGFAYGMQNRLATMASCLPFPE